MIYQDQIKWVVEVTGPNGVAKATGGGVEICAAMFSKRSRAIEFKNKLKPHLPNCKMKIVKARVQITKMKAKGDT